MQLVRPLSCTPLADIDNEAAGSGGLLVLVVDDDPTNRAVLKAMLGKDGYSIVMAENGQQAIELFDRQQPDLVLMDVMMPEMDGYQATRIIKERSRELERYVPVIFLTAITDNELLAKCVESGGDDFLTKPFSAVILRAKVAAAARTRRLYATLQQQRDELVLHRQRLQEEHQLAERVFEKVIDTSGLAAANLRYSLSPKDIHNGDLLLASSNPDGSQMIMMGDFTGHGLSAAIGAIPVADLFYAMTSKGFRLRDIISELNRKVYFKLPTGLFLAACLIEIGPDGRSVSAWSGGVPDALIVDSRGIKHRIQSRNLPLGIVDNPELGSETEEFQLQEGDRILVYSDGLIEACNPECEMYGEARLERCVADNQDREQLVAEILGNLKAFRRERPQCDDITLMEIRCIPRDQDRCSEDGAGETPNLAAATNRLSLRLDSDALRGFDPLSIVDPLVVEIDGLAEHKVDLYAVVAELYANALNHGILGLDSRQKDSADGFAAYYRRRDERLEALEDGWVEIDIAHQRLTGADRLIIRMRDSGQGFDLEAAAKQPEMQSPHGYGISIVRSLCKSLSYSENGRSVEAVYEWTASGVDAAV